MSEHSGHAVDIDRHVRTYILVFVSLMVLTVVTVGLYYLELSVPMGIALALAVASVKAGLVACFFMHLIDERKLIYWVLSLTIFLFLVLIFTGFMTRATTSVILT
ncbi:MAG TPA: cytochrome C oxidase subunit IV family protein [Thermoanaerobaculia bacterium]|nr:cytochrome C oxidase subunit IV family protein [Thermoanaerobaculia bacterium]